MGGVHEDREGQSKFNYTVYRLGSIIRDAKHWGVVIRASGNKYHSQPYDVVWWQPGDGWVRQVYATPPKYITAPFSHGDPSIPINVVAKATEVILRGEL